MQENLLKIINHYGVLSQLKHFQTEVWELNEAIIKNEEYKKYNDRYTIFTFNEIAEEIADCLVMIKQFQHIYGITDLNVEEIMNYKINRQLDRISKEGDNNGD